jgi:endo-1,4-beta-xylanase
MFALVDYLRKSRAPIDGIGLQYHIQLRDLPKPDDGHYKMIEQIENHGLDFMITELDVAIPCAPAAASDPQPGLIPLHADDLARQAEVYGSVFQMALRSPHCRGIQMWGLTDRHSWIPGYERGMGAALLLDGDYRSKPAYDAVSKVLVSHRIRSKA